MTAGSRPPMYEGWKQGADGLTVIRGKVRDIVDLGSRLIITTTDRVSAFDRVLGLVPFKGEILNRLSLYWFEQTKDIIPNHLIEQVTARTVLVRRSRVLPVEVVVRGYLTGSAWRDYQAGQPISGKVLPAGLRFNERFDDPIITPSTKAEQGSHDMPISGGEIVSSGLVSAALWQQVETAALALFRRGTELAAGRGLILVDTKYEFGVTDGKLTLVDEIHTPDSSRYWYADSYDELFARGSRQRQMDKEYLRNWLSDRGFTGDGVPPEIPAEVFDELSRRYRTAFEEITGARFESEIVDPEAERQKIMYTINTWQQRD